VSNINLDSVLSKVRGLIAKAEHESTPPHEAELARQMADALMLKYTIKEIGEQPAAQRAKPMILTIQIGPESDVQGYFAGLLRDIAKHCRCRSRLYTSWTDGCWNAKVYGFEPDVRYFEMLYTTVRLHMLGILLPKVDPSESLEENAYRLHSSGYNWLQIAEMYGWRKYDYRRPYLSGELPPNGLKVPYWHKDEGWQPATQVGSRIKRAYHRAVKERGENGQIIAANGTTSYRKSAADGYTGMIRRRLYEMAKSRESGNELILRSLIDDIDKLFKEDNPDLFVEVKEEPSNAKKTKTRLPRYKPLNLNMDAYRRGADHARTADLDAHHRAGSDQRGAIGG